LLEALVWRITGDRSTATWVAGWAGRVVAVLVVLWGLSPLVLDGQRVSITRFAWAFTIALFLWQGAGQAGPAGWHGRTAARLRLGEVARPVAVVAPHTTLAEVPWEQSQLWVVQPDGGEPEALVHPATLAKVPDADRATVPASAVALRMPQGWAVRVG